MLRDHPDIESAERTGYPCSYWESQQSDDYHDKWDDYDEDWDYIQSTIDDEE